MKRITLLLLLLPVVLATAQKKRLRDYGVEIGVMPTGKLNAITDVKGVRVGHVTLIEGDAVRTGVTAIIPHDKNVFQWKVPAAIFIGNGFGKLAGYSQVKELGNIETPIILTNTLGVATGIQGLLTYTLSQPENAGVQSVNAVVGETNDGGLNDIRKRPVREEHVLEALRKASSGAVAEGNVGAGTGTICFGFKGGIGTSSRLLPASLGGYTVGVLVQTNFGGNLEIAGVPVGRELDRYPFRKALTSSDGSCMIVVATDAPLDARNLERLAMRAMLGLGKTGGIAANGSGDYVIALSTAEQNLIQHNPETSVYKLETIHNDYVTPLFMAAIEATEEAILNSLFAAETLTGKDGYTAEAIPVDKVVELLKKYNRIK
jgi:D-aminopeptidase